MDEIKRASTRAYENILSVCAGLRIAVPKNNEDIAYNNALGDVFDSIIENEADYLIPGTVSQGKWQRDNMKSDRNAYWYGTGKYQNWVDKISDTMPNCNKTDNVYMNVFIALSNIYHDIYNNDGGNICDGIYDDDLALINSYLKGLKPTAYESFHWEQAIDEKEYLEAKMDEIIETLIDKDLCFTNQGFWINYNKREVSLKEPVGGPWIYISIGTESKISEEIKRLKSQGFKLSS